MYRATPLSYFISGIMSVGLSGVDKITCEQRDIASIPATPANATCASYLANYLSISGSQLLNPDATVDCLICPYGGMATLLATYGILYSQRWRNWGITIAYSAINVVLAFLLWRLVKVQKTARKG